uniref:Uncharacterized protein n=1 Tax=Anguilla anguilla TaxID=7936 RepID=A0A0E9PJE3_ANGAN
MRYSISTCIHTWNTQIRLYFK